MVQKMIYIIMFFTILYSCKNNSEKNWELFWVEPGNNFFKVAKIDIDNKKPSLFEININNIAFLITTQPNKNGLALSAVANVKHGSKAEGYFSLRKSYSYGEVPFNFLGEVKTSETYRQSPHDVNAWIVDKIPMQAMPVVAIKTREGFEAAFSDSPAIYNNFTCQEFDTQSKNLYLNSGDNGTSPGIQPDTSKVLNIDYNAEKTQVFTPGKVLAYYHKVDENTPHNFKAVVFKSKVNNLNQLRKDIIKNAAFHFSKDSIFDFFGALSFTTAYFNLRTNDSGKSRYWVVPAVEYANRQYGRDAFWISMMLPPEFAFECLNSELNEVNHYAEYPLMTVIWAYRSVLEGFDVDMEKVQAYVDAIGLRVKDNRFYSYTEADGRLDFQYWGDVMAFNKNDVIAFNQGLFAVAMDMAEKLNLNVKTDVKAAKKHYRNLFNNELGFMPLSREKAVLTPDAIIPDLLSQIYLGEKLLDSEKVEKHFTRVTEKSKTEYGFKIVATPDGEFLPSEAYDVPGYESQVNREKMPNGRYYAGGSYFLYDNLFLLDAYLHHIKGAEELLKWRIGLDFGIGSTTYECLNTITGEPWKPNMGWNVAIYAFWKNLILNGKATPDLLNHIDNIVNQ